MWWLEGGATRPRGAQMKAGPYMPARPEWQAETARRELAARQRALLVAPSERGPHPPVKKRALGCTPSSRILVYAAWAWRERPGTPGGGWCWFSCAVAGLACQPKLPPAPAQTASGQQPAPCHQPIKSPRRAAAPHLRQQLGRRALAHVARQRQQRGVRVNVGFQAAAAWGNRQAYTIRRLATGRGAFGGMHGVQHSAQNGRAVPQVQALTCAASSPALGAPPAPGPAA